LGIERLEKRLQMHRIMLSWFEYSTQVKSFLDAVDEAIDELNDAECLQGLKHVLAAVLSLGNYMNGNNSRGGAHGYRLDVILKLKDLKQTGYGRRSMLHFLVDQLPQLFPEEGPFYSNWKQMWQVSNTHKHSIEDLLRDLKVDLDKCMVEIDEAEYIENETVRNMLLDRLSKQWYHISMTTSLF
jgi:hypothetical protein